jgi:hypothetical protein
MPNSPTSELPASAACGPAEASLPPRNPTGERVLWLLAIAAPAAWVIGPALAALAAGPPNYDVNISLPSLAGLAVMTMLATFPVLLCLVTVWAVLPQERLLVSLPRGAAQLAVLYLSMMALLLLDPLRIWSMPWAVALGVGLFALPPLLVCFVLRWFRWRLVWRRSAAEALPLAARYQFRLADVFAWMTLAAVFLGLGSVILSPFHKEPSGWDSLGPAIIFMLSAMLCGPTGVGSVVFAWLVLAEGRRRARAIVGVCLLLTWMASILWVLVENGPRPYQPSPDTYLALATPVALVLPALALLGLARLAGWHMVRLPKT